MPGFDDFMIHDEFFQSKTHDLVFIVGQDYARIHEMGSWLRANCTSATWARSPVFNVWWNVTFEDSNEAMIFKLTWMGQ